MIISKLKLKNFKKHPDAEFNFLPGSNMIVGPNYAGKSSIMQAILIGLLGNSVISDCKAEELVTLGQKDFQLELTLSTGHTIVRTLKNSSVARAGEEPYARGHTSVNKAVLELLGQQKDTFLKVFASLQGSPQKLLEMEGAELQKFIESVIGIDKLDVVLKESNRRVNAAKDKTEALDYLVLNPEALEGALAAKESLEHGLGVSEAAISMVNAELAGLDKQIVDARFTLSSTVANNNAIDQYNFKVRAITEALGGREPLLLPEVAHLRQRVVDCEGALAQVKEMAAAQQAINDEWRRYESDKASLEAQLNQVFVYQTKPEDLQAAIDTLQAEHNAIGLDIRTRHELETQMRGLEKQIAANTLEGLEDDGTTQEMLEAMRVTLADAEVNERHLRFLLKNSTCPTCKQTIGEVDPARVQADLDTSVLASATARKLVDEVQSRLTACLEYRRRAEVLPGLLQEQQEVVRALEALPTPVDPSELSGKLTALRLEFNKVSLAASQRAALEARLSALREPAGSVADYLGTGPYEESLAAARVALAGQEAELARVLEHNRQVEKLRSDLLALVVPTEPWEPVEPLEAAVAALQTKFADLQADLQQHTQFKHAAELELAPILAKLDAHDKAYEKCKEFYADAEDYRFISQLLSNSRAGFIEKAMHTIFTVTSEYCRLSTNGDIEEVLFDGGIKYKEKGHLMGKGIASGAQRSLIGLGMKLGVANLVLTPFSSLLLDEASADMSEEISMQAFLAMSTMCEQSISVSHRQMDIAGNVIQL